MSQRVDGCEVSPGLRVDREWKTRLLKAGAVDELASLPPAYGRLQQLAADKGAWLLSLDFTDAKERWQRLSGTASAVLMEGGTKRGDAPLTEKIKPHNYKTVSATCFPCTCAYRYSGYTAKGHRSSSSETMICAAGQRLRCIHWGGGQGAVGLMV